MNDILKELSKPFPPADITWKPGAINGKKDSALALAYADLRAYMNRLDEVCGLDWAVSYTPWSERVICHLTISGVTRSSTGEPDSASERQEISGTVAEAQAFKRACAMFGLGRYLYTLPTVWVEYDEKRQAFTDKALSRLNGIITQHYQRQSDNRDERTMGSATAPVVVKPTVQAAHRSQRAPEVIGQQAPSVGVNPPGLETDIDMGMGRADVPTVALPVVWPYEVDELAYMLKHSSVYNSMPELSSRLVNFLITEDDASQDKRLSTISKDGKGSGQYGLLAGKLDAKYGKGSHRAVLSILCKRVVTGEDAPGWKVKVVLDWLMDEANNAQKIQALDGVAISLREALQVT